MVLGTTVLETFIGSQGTKTLLWREPRPPAWAQRNPPILALSLLTEPQCRREQAKAREHWSKKPPHLLTSPEKRSGVGKEESRKMGSGVVAWLADVWQGEMTGEMSGGEQTGVHGCLATAQRPD